MTEQNQSIDVRLKDPAAIADRAAERKRRTLSGVVAMVVIAGAGFGMWAMATGPDAGTPTAVVASEPDAARDGQGSAAASSADGTVNDSAVAPDDYSSRIVVGQPLEATVVQSENSPGYAGNSVYDGGVYYVLSTSPGKFEPIAATSPEEYELAYRNDTFYVFDEDTGWTVAEVTDRFVSDFAARDGVLYAVSTGSAAGVGFSVGTSSDRGSTWSWTDVAAPEQAESANLQIVVGETGGPLVLGQKLPLADFNDALELAQSAGYAVDEYSLFWADFTGFHWDPDAADGTSCSGINNEYYQRTGQIYDELYGSEELAFDEIEGDYDPSVYEERWAEVEAIARERISVFGPEFEQRLVAAGCFNFIECDRITLVVNEDFKDRQQAIDREYTAIYAAAEESGNNNEIWDSPEMQLLNERSEALWQVIDAANREAMVGTDCYNPRYEESVPTFVSWEEAGVTVPASWDGWSAVYRFDGSTVSEVAYPFGDEIVVAARSEEGLITVVTMTQEQYNGPGPVSAPLPPPLPVPTPSAGPIAAPGFVVEDAITEDVAFENGVPFPTPAPLPPGGVTTDVYAGDVVYSDEGTYENEWTPVGTEWKSTDGTNWSTSVTTNPWAGDYGYSETATVGEHTYRFQWVEPTHDGTENYDEPISPLIQRSTSGGPWVDVPLESLVPGLTTEGRYVSQLYEGSVAVFITVVENDGTAATVLYSSDGQTWNTVDLAANFVQFVPGSNSVLILGQSYEAGTESTVVLVRPAA